MNKSEEISKPKKKRGRKRGNTGPYTEKTPFGGHGRLNAGEEQKLSLLTDPEMEQEIKKYLLQMENVSMFSQGSLYGAELRRFKSLVHIYTSRPNVVKRIEMNVRILMSVGEVSSMARLCNELAIHPSYVWRLLKGTGWSWAMALVPICLTLKVKPSVLLFEDLHYWVKWVARLEDGLEQPERKSL